MWPNNQLEITLTGLVFVLVRSERTRARQTQPDGHARAIQFDRYSLKKEINDKRRSPEFSPTGTIVLSF